MGFWLRKNWSVASRHHMEICFTPKAPPYLKQECFEVRLIAYYVGVAQIESILTCYFHIGGEAHVASSDRKVEGVYPLPPHRPGEDLDTYLKRLMPMALRLTERYWREIGIKTIQAKIAPASRIWNPENWEKSERNETLSLGAFHFKMRGVPSGSGYFAMTYQKLMILEFSYQSKNPDDFETRLQEVKRKVASLTTLLGHIQDTL